MRRVATWKSRSFKNPFEIINIFRNELKIYFFIHWNIFTSTFHVQNNQWLSSGRYFQVGKVKSQDVFCSFWLKFLTITHTLSLKPFLGKLKQWYFVYRVQSRAFVFSNSFIFLLKKTSLFLFKLIGLSFPRFSFKICWLAMNY